MGGGGGVLLRFLLLKIKNSNSDEGFNYFFEIQLHSKDEDLLKQIQASFSGVGSIYKYSNKKSIKFRVRSIKHMKIIIMHFDKFSMITEYDLTIICLNKPFILWS